MSIKEKWPIYIPEMHEKGTHDGLFWFVMDYFDAKNSLSDPFKGYISKDFIKDYLDKTIDFIFIMQKLRVKLLTDTDKRFYFYRCRNKKNISQLIKWSIRHASRQIGFDNKEVMKIIDSTRFEGTQLAHTDYKPWHMFRYKDKIALIDSENANNLAPRYYDIASYYARVLFILDREDIVHELIKRFYRRVADEHKESFMEQFRALVAWIAVGESRDAVLKKTPCPGKKRIFELIRTNNFMDK